MPQGIPRNCARVLRGHRGVINAVHFNEKGTYVMTCGHDKTIRLWNPHRDGLESTNEALLVKTYEGRHGYDVQDVTIAHDNSTFASCGREKAVFLWDVPTGQVIRKFEGHAHEVNCVKFNPNSSVLLSGSYDKTIRVWDLRARNAFAPVQIIDDFKDSVTSITVTRSSIIAGCVDGIVYTFDLFKGRILRDQIGEPVVSVDVSPDDKCVIASSLDGSLRLIDRKSGRELNCFIGHRVDQYRIDCRFSNDGAYVISGSEDGKIFYWDTVSRMETSFQAHTKAVRTIAFHPEDPIVISGSEDSVAKVWTLH